MGCTNLHDTRELDQLTQWILRRLGAPKVCIELTKEHVEDSITDAKLWFASYKGSSKSYLLAVNAGQSKYTLPDDVDVVLDVIFTIKPADISTLFTPVSVFDERIPYDLYANSGQLGTYSSYVQLTQYIELTRRVTNAENDWRQENRDLLLWPVPSGGSNVMVFYSTTQVDFSQLSIRDFEFIRKYALALSKRDLGRVRSKRDEWPSAQGTTRLDGERLLQEAETEMEKLTEDLLSSGSPMPFMTG